MRIHLKPKPQKPQLNKTCVTCNYVFTRVEALNNHLKTGCQGGPKLQKPQANKTCVTCNYTFIQL